MLPVLLLLALLLPHPASATMLHREPGKEQPPLFEQQGANAYSSDVLGFGYLYTVRAGDDLWLIATAHGINMEELAALNGLKPPYWLQPDDTLWIPAAPAAVKHRVAAKTQAVPKATSPAPAAQVTAPAAASLPANVSDMAGRMLEMMNQKRVAYGLSALTWSPELAAAAQAHANDCSQRGWGSHVGSDGSRLRERLARAGYSPSWAGENWANTSGVQGAFDMWWFEGPGGPHYENIMHPNFTQAGIGVAHSTWGYYFIVDFGRP